MYAIFSIRKLTATSRLNMAQVQLMNLDDQQYALATQRMNIENEQATKRIEIAKKMGVLAENGKTSDDGEYKKLETELTQVNEQGTLEKNTVAAQENAIELQKKALETQITKWSKELEVIEKAESEGIDRANPKYSGLG